MFLRSCLAALILSLAACASDPTATAHRGDPDPRICLKDTGSHIPRRADDPKDCVAAPGQSYSQQDLERTGSTDTAEALRKLSPAIR